MPTDITQHDHRPLRCPKLGHEVQFTYCRCHAGELPCNKIFDCWWQSFDITAFIKEHYTKDHIKKIIAPPKPKMTSLIEMIQQAQRHQQ